MRLLNAFLSVVFLFLILGAASFVTLGLLMEKPGPLVTEKTVLIDKGAGGITIANQLEKEGVIEKALLFRLAVRFERAGRDLKAGEYRFPAKVSMMDVVNILRQGKSVGYYFTAVEGWTVKQILNELKTTEHLTGEVTKLPEEGSLLPDTYQYARGDTRQSVIDQMALASADYWTKVWPDRAENLPFTSIDEAKVLASIVEKETSLPEEWGAVAGVFVNRLRKGMLLQTDPTVVYAVTNKLGHMQGKRLLLKHLEVDSPYNTYKYAGLPPKPIANPSRAAIDATLHPEEHDYIFFVADGTGGHAFAKTLKEHNANVAKWRKHRRETGK